MALSNIDKNHLVQLIESKYNEVEKYHQNENMILQATIQAKLDILFKQMDLLKKEIIEVASQADIYNQLNSAKCNFKKIPGNTYHLYHSKGRQQLLKDNYQMDLCYFSMLSPDDWNNQHPHHYLGSFQYNLDSSWTKM